jgi:hypothetical protein
MPKKRKPSDSSDAMQRQLNALAAAVLSMMEQRGQGARQTYRDFDPQDAFEYPSEEMFAENLQADTVGEGPITDYAAQVTGGRNAMSRAVADRAGNQYMRDVYSMILRSLAGNPKRGVR